MNLFQVNNSYSRNIDIHPKLGGLANHGSTQRSTKYPIIMLFSDWSGKQTWYRDDWSEDHTVFRFAGSQQIAKDNMVKNHIHNGDALYLFLRCDSGKMYKFLGEFVYLNTILVDSSNGVIPVYELLPTSIPSATNNHEELELRTAAYRGKSWSTPPPGQIRPELVEGPKSSSWKRDPATRAFVLDRSKGACELCHQPAPFKTPKGTPFLEVHHVTTLANGGSDTWTNAVALCPNCHRNVHHGESAESHTAALAAFLNNLRKHSSQNA